jgi:hypothetical protein
MSLHPAKTNPKNLMLFEEWNPLPSRLWLKLWKRKRRMTRSLTLLRYGKKP